MRLTKNNIRRVSCLVYRGVPYEWNVVLKDHSIRTFININYENGKTVQRYYDIKRLPKTIQNFINNSIRVLDENYFFPYLDEYKRYIYKSAN